MGPQESVTPWMCVPWTRPARNTPRRALGQTRFWHPLLGLSSALSAPSEVRAVSLCKEILYFQCSRSPGQGRKGRPS